MSQTGVKGLLVGDYFQQWINILLVSSKNGVREIELNKITVPMFIHDNKGTCHPVKKCGLFMCFKPVFRQLGTKWHRRIGLMRL